MWKLRPTEAKWHTQDYLEFNILRFWNLFPNQDYNPGLQRLVRDFLQT
jgi:hypothetical protein